MVGRKVVEKTLSFLVWWT